MIHPLATYLAGQIADLDYRPDDPGGNVYANSEMADAPDLAVMISSTGGLEPHVRLNYGQGTFQVMVRAGTVAEAETIWGMIFDELHGLRSQVLSDGTRIVLCAALQDLPLKLDPDGRDRPRLTCNYRTLANRPGGTNR